MNEQDEKILELYLKDIKKKRIFFLVTTIFIIASIFLYGFYANNKKTLNDAENFIQEEVESNSINEKNTNEEIIKNTPSKENIEKQNELSEMPKEKYNIDAKEENNKTQNNNFQSNKPIKTDNKKGETKPNKPPNKDFLFKDGYNMENVSQVAQDYLKSSGYAGECIPLKDNEGVYIGMRVVFY